ncbi:TIGR03013 family XrtA/PEP-CTERM system glycosyltransferase [Desulfohalovibrio reitneri]|uniref:TIGR03013 family XrtA/PEP-CTERM system glycosyltransferase n=1 Tax=Desulfohalovibrio reitneri TaxID=1307759 RepID=UPI0004A72AEF|nr:TIGR03013 family XrtA/PEP-CTERM system glycosyltransferase [Desulfohalovibrio reitneri]
MKGLLLRHFATDTLLALLALSAATLALAGGVEDLLQRGILPDESVRFLLVAVIPSALLGMFVRESKPFERLMKGLIGGLSAFAVSLAVLFLLDSVQALSPDRLDSMLMALILFAALKMLVALGARLRGNLPGMAKRILVVGSGPLAEQMGSLAAQSGERFRFLGRVDCPGCGDNACSDGGEDTSRLLRVASNFMADKVVVSLAERRGVFPVREMLSCKLSGIEVLDAPSFYEQVNEKLLIENITPSWFIFNPGFRINPIKRFNKRTVDILLSLVGIAVALPVIPFVMLAIKLDSPGPLLFSQVRVGRGDKPFTLHKFRTMRQDAESGTGAVWSQPDDPRITPVGRFLRKSRLDELPQLINILRGDMSLVGPRPERPEFVAKLKERIPYYSERHYVKPGLSGWAQVRYPYGSSVEDAIEKLRYDLYYVKHLSLWLDLRVIMRTVSVVLLGKGGR